MRREQQELAMAAEMMRSAKLERAKQQRLEKQQAEAEEYVTHLLRTGHRWHTVSEALSLEAGHPIHVGY